MTLKVQGHHRAGHGGLDREQSQLYFFLYLGGGQGWVVNAVPKPLHPRENPGTHYTGGWVDHKAGMDGFKKSRTHLNSIPESSSQSLYRQRYHRSPC